MNWHEPAGRPVRCKELLDIIYCQGHTVESVEKTRRLRDCEPALHRRKFHPEFLYFYSLRSVVSPDFFLLWKVRIFVRLISLQCEIIIFYKIFLNFAINSEFMEELVEKAATSIGPRSGKTLAILIGSLFLSIVRKTDGKIRSRLNRVNVLLLEETRFSMATLC